jgi:hypothetical protein
MMPEGRDLRGKLETGMMIQLVGSEMYPWYSEEVEQRMSRRRSTGRIRSTKKPGGIDKR